MATLIRTEGRSPRRCVLPVRAPYSLQRTLSCGQVFRWHCDGALVSGLFAGRPVRLVQERDGIWVDGLADADELLLLRQYLGLDEPLGVIEQHLARDPVLREVLAYTSGIALLRQDPWECLISFIISAFNNIPKIAQSLERLAVRFGTPLGGAGYAFPTSDQLAQATRAQLRRCLLGYRVPYVRAVARQVAARTVDLEAIGALSYEEARATLLRLPGVGEKVADCVLLFAYGKRNAFPVDIWVQRVVERRYFGGRARTLRQIRAFARSRFGALAGYAQQHLFYYARTAGRPEELIVPERSRRSLRSGGKHTDVISSRRSPHRPRERR